MEKMEVKMKILEVKEYLLCENQRPHWAIGSLGQGHKLGKSDVMWKDLLKEYASQIWTLHPVQTEGYKHF